MNTLKAYIIGFFQSFIGCTTRRWNRNTWW